MKKFIAIVALAVASLTTNAQNYLVENPDNVAYFGARLGVDITATPGSAEFSTYNNGGGFSFGAIYNIPVYKNLYVEPGLSIFYDTFSENLDFIDQDLPEIPYQISHSFRNFGFRIPMTCGYRFDFTDQVSIAPFTGPQFNLSLYAHDHWSDEAKTEGKSLFGENGFKHLDMQWTIGASVTYDRYVFTAAGAFGITRVYQMGADKLRRNTCTISVGYNF